MPSPTESTRPISETFASEPKPLICSLRIAEISAARTSITYSSGGFQGETQSVQLGFDGSIELARRHRDHAPAHQAVIRRGFSFHFRAERFADSVDDGFLLALAQRAGGDDFNLAGAAVAGDQGAVRGRNRWQFSGAAILGGDA